MKIFIRNMACESCKVFVKEALENLKLHPVKVDLGEAEIKESMNPKQRDSFNSMIKKVGLEVVENKGAILIERIKASVLEYIDKEKQSKSNFSDYLSKELKYDYNYLSNIFSEIQSTTITNYMNMVRMERAKELILFEDMTLTEIAEKLHYNTLSSFSAQFKKTTGFSPSHFKNLKSRRRLAMQELLDTSLKQ